MSQKTDPTSLRLQKTNKHFSSSWYSDSFYSQMIADDLQTRSYIEGLSEQIGQSQMFPYMQRYYKRAYTYLFFLDAREIRSQREKLLRLSRRGQKHATSIAASTAFLRSYLDYRENNSVETAPSIFLPTLQSNNTKEKDQISYPYQWRDDFKKLPFFRFGLNQTSLTQLVLNCSIFRDLVVQNSNGLNKRKLSFTYSSKKYIGIPKRSNDALFISFGAQMHYPFDKDNKWQPNSYLKDRGMASLGVKKVAEPLQNAFALAVPSVNLNSFYNFCAVGQVSFKQRAMCFAAESAPILNLFHRTTEAAFLLAHPVSTGGRARNTDKRLVNAADLTNFRVSGEAARLKSHLEQLHSYPYCTPSSAVLRPRLRNHLIATHKHSILTSIYPIRVVQDLQFVGFLAQEIAHLLQKGASFKQVQNRILSEHKKNEIIKGIRLSCSGRIGGRSKKAQKSKVQSVQWGETSLHVLSSKLSFASRSANTPFGKIGIKLWLCFQ